MSASLSIQVVVVVHAAAIQEIKFFEADDWNADPEKQLLHKMQDLLAVTRNVGKSFEVKINIEVNNIQAAVFFY